LKELLDLLKVIKEIQIDEKKFKIKFLLSCDYKMLRILYGQKAPNAEFGCVYCNNSLKKNTKDFHTQNLTINRELTDELDQNEPLIDFIDFKDCIFDILHAFLRISDDLFKTFLSKLNQKDQNQGYDIDRRPNFKIFMNFLATNCKISNPFYVSRKTDEIKLRNLNATERDKIFDAIFENYENTENQIVKKNFNFIQFPNTNPDEFKHENFVWFTFHKIYKKLSNLKPFVENVTNPLSENTPSTSAEQKKVWDSEFEKDLNLLIRSFSKLNYASNFSYNITPYWHVLYFHTKELLERHNEIASFSNQSNEKLQHFMKICYVRSTNKKRSNKKYLKQVLKKRNRMEFFFLDGNLDDFFINQNADLDDFFNYYLNESDEDSENDSDEEE
jgi:hypothetical protein